MLRRIAVPRCAGAAAALVMVVGVLAIPTAAGAGSNGDCEGPPVTMRIESSDTTVALDLDVTDGVARRVPILTGRDEPASTPKELERLEREAAKSKLAMYQIYLADFRIPRKELTGPFSSAFYTPAVKAEKTAVVLAIVPPRARGLREGEVITPDDEQRYETVTTFAPVSVVVVTEDGDGGFGTASGQVEVLELDDDSICVDVDFRITDFDGVVTAGLDGVVEVPVVRARNESLFFF